MNKNGFTLMEMLAVIIMIGILSVVVGLNIVSMNNKQNEKDYNQFVKTIENAGCTFVEMLSYKNDIVTVDGKTLENCHGEKCTISLATLISYGFLNNDLTVYEYDGESYYSTKETLATYKNNNNSVLWINNKNVDVIWYKNLSNINDPKNGLKECTLR